MGEGWGEGYGPESSTPSPDLHWTMRSLSSGAHFAQPLGIAMSKSTSPRKGRGGSVYTDSMIQSKIIRV